MFYEAARLHAVCVVLQLADSAPADEAGHMQIREESLEGGDAWKKNEPEDKLSESKHTHASRASTQILCPSHPGVYIHLYTQYTALVNSAGKSRESGGLEETHSVGEE